VIFRIIEASVRNRFFVLIITGMVVAVGWWALRTMPIDAIPDLSDVQVIVYTEYSGQAPQVVEDQVTYPLSTAMLSVPYATVVRGYSFFGFSMVYIIFEDGTDLYWARSRVLEYLNYVQGRLPAGTTPVLGPDATGVGWIYEYTLTDFSPRARVLRANMDADGSGTVEARELPAALEVSLVGGSARCELRLLRWCLSEEIVGGQEVPVYSEAQLIELFRTDTPPATKTLEAFQEDSLGYLIDGFD
jgi:Cu(I)/Ag(I) efflux system membrane protein CusA/SilA